MNYRPHRDKAVEHVKAARASFERVLADPKASPAAKYAAAVMLDEVKETEQRIAEIDRIAEDLKRRARE